jgi:thioredoxin reductase (NADPH)
MSNYLIERILKTPNIEVHYDTTVRWMTGDKELREVRIVNSKTGEERTLPIQALFSFIGAEPQTDWLPAEIERDEKNFIRTGTAVADASRWTLRRQPFLLETSRPGVFAAGDVRSGSVKRVASAVGEGAMTVQFVHAHLQGT